ncbi:transposable element Tc1 transposase [Trichonephila inaurata madagascariensis]|uniref:Transposable element Tc1 transposase n=1 Tax=Trichonephila inaurata madagascariensis TaxID=2747483 RepID=A0A8X6WQM5_9ARAC|nr:transposable element Tc1 transposase [Trichonephila inaurata madagascariensis]
MRGNVLNKSRCGRPHKLSDRDARAIVRKVKKNPKIRAPKLVDQIATASGKKVHPETVRRILRSGGYNGRVSSRKPFISSVNQQKRLDFASPHSPDLNPIEHLWVEVDRRVRQQAISSKETLRKAIEHAWAQISPETTKNLVMSVPNRMQAVIASKGGPTKY